MAYAITRCMGPGAVTASLRVAGVAAFWRRRWITANLLILKNALSTRRRKGVVTMPSLCWFPVAWHGLADFKTLQRHQRILLLEVVVNGRCSSVVYLNILFLPGRRDR